VPAPQLPQYRSTNSKTTCRLNTNERDVIVLRGPPSTAASQFLQGNVVFSCSEPLSIKRVSLRLYCTIRLKWVDPVLVARANTIKPIRFERILYEHEWSNLEAGNRTNNNTTPSTAQSHTLAPGNHELPFELVLPGSLEESVEGLEGGQVVYKLVATIERGRFANNIVAKKHLRVVRTLGPDALELSQTMSMENIWPGKVEYSISVPAKAVAVGSFTPIHMHLIPLLKGLRLGPTKVFLHEYKVLTTSLGFTNDAERIVAEFTIPAPEDGFEGHDEWIVDQDFMMPTSLSKCTQDVQISTFIKVTHKLKFAVSLLNPDGHVSELRASLPVCLFISPNVTITSLHRTVSGPSNGTSTVAGPSSSNGGGSSSHAGPSSGAESEEPQEDQLFAAAANTNTHLTGADVNAPPNYQDHIYDRLWREIPDSSIETPFASEPSTPYARSRRNSLESHDNMGFGPLDRSRLLSNLYALQERQNREDSVGLPPDRLASGANLTGTSPYHSRFSSRSTSGANTPREGFNALQMTTATGSPPVTSHTPSIAIDSTNANQGQNHQLQFAVSPDFSHLSHPTSPLGPQSPANALYLDLESLSRVPSYHTAISTAASPTFESAPSYGMSVPGSPIYISPPSSLPRHLAGGAGSHSMSNITAAHNRAKSHRSNASAPGSALNLHSLNLKLSRITIGNSSGSNNPNNNKNNSNGSNGVVESHSPRLSFSVPHTRSHSSSNLQGLVGNSTSGAATGAMQSIANGSSATGPSASSSSSGFFRSSSRTHLASLGSNPNGGSSSSNSSGANANRNASSATSTSARGGFSHTNRNSSSRSLFDEATRFLHLSHK
jgi:hypothetical protein